MKIRQDNRIDRMKIILIIGYVVRNPSLVAHHSRHESRVTGHEFKELL
jgi:hypothetical protein